MARSFNTLISTATLAIVDDDWEDDDAIDEEDDIDDDDGDNRNDIDGDNDRILVTDVVDDDGGGGGGDGDDDDDEVNIDDVNGGELSLNVTLCFGDCVDANDGTAGNTRGDRRGGNAPSRVDDDSGELLPDRNDGDIDRCGDCGRDDDDDNNDSALPPLGFDGVDAVIVFCGDKDSERDGELDNEVSAEVSIFIVKALIFFFRLPVPITVEGCDV